MGLLVLVLFGGSFMCYNFFCENFGLICTKKLKIKIIQTFIKKTNNIILSRFRLYNHILLVRCGSQIQTQNILIKQTHPKGTLGERKESA